MDFTHSLLFISPFLCDLNTNKKLLTMNFIKSFSLSHFGFPKEHAFLDDLKDYNVFYEHKFSFNFNVFYEDFLSFGFKCAPFLDLDDALAHNLVCEIDSFLVCLNLSFLASCLRWSQEHSISLSRCFHFYFWYFGTNGLYLKSTTGIILR